MLFHGTIKKIKVTKQLNNFLIYGSQSSKSWTSQKRLIASSIVDTYTNRRRNEKHVFLLTSLILKFPTLTGWQVVSLSILGKLGIDNLFRLGAMAPTHIQTDRKLGSRKYDKINSLCVILSRSNISLPARDKEIGHLTV